MRISDWSSDVCSSDLVSHQSKVSSVPADDGSALLTFDWCETGGPPATEPQQKGFGSRLIERSIVGELHGQLKMDYRQAGLACRRSEERRVGEEGVRKCRFRWATVT